VPGAVGVTVGFPRTAATQQAELLKIQSGQLEVQGEQLESAFLVKQGLIREL
jgi:hypothetical protein